jgi:hypothetical protein
MNDQAAAGGRTRVPSPKFSTIDYEGYMAQVEVWQKICGVPKEEQGMMLWYCLPDEHSSDIKAKIYTEVGVEQLSSEEGVDKFVAAMNDAFKQEEEAKVYQVYTEFLVEMKRGKEEKVKDFIVRFDKLANIAKKNNMELPTTVLGLKLLHDAGLTINDKKLVMSEIDFKKKETIYKNAKAGLAKYLTDGTGLTEATSGVRGIKLENALTAEDELVLEARGWVRRRHEPRRRRRARPGSRRRRTRQEAQPFRRGWTATEVHKLSKHSPHARRLPGQLGADEEGGQGAPSRRGGRRRVRELVLRHRIQGQGAEGDQTGGGGGCRPVHRKQQEAGQRAGKRDAREPAARLRKLQQRGGQRLVEQLQGGPVKEAEGEGDGEQRKDEKVQVRRR